MVRGQREGLSELRRVSIVALTLQELKERGFVNPVRVIHTLCGAIVFFTDGHPQKKEGILNPDKCILINGAKPQMGDPIICSGCGYEVRKNQLQWILQDE